MDDLSLGIAHFNAGRFAAALPRLRAAPGGERLLGPAYAGLAKWLLSRSPARDRAAERALRGVLALAPGTPGLEEALRDAGRAFRAAGDLAAAEKAFARAGAGEELAELLVARGSEKDLRRALALAPQGPAREALARLLRRRGLDLQARGRAYAAAVSLRRALVLSPADAEARRALAQLEAAAVRAKKALLEAAAARARARKRIRDDARRRRERKAAAARERRLARLREKALAYDIPNAPERRDRALRAWDAVLAADPADGSARIAQSLLLRWIGRPADERAALEAAVTPTSRLERPARFSALMRLGRGAEAVLLAEEALREGPSLADLRAFWDPWEKDNRPDRGAPEADWREISVPEPWQSYFLGLLDGPLGLKHFDGLPRAGRYAWMHYAAALKALFSGDFRRAISSFQIAPMDWRSRGYQAEAHACVNEPALARREMAKAVARAPRPEKPQALAWQAELDLWLGAYERALSRASRAAALGAPFAHGWKGAALLKLGRKREALAQLDRALTLFPHDDEARLWRAEALRELGQFRRSLDELASVTRQHAVWIDVNRALARKALGDEAGLRADFAALPEPVSRRLLRESPDPAAALEAGLELARGFRRGEYGQAVWLCRESS